MAFSLAIMYNIRAVLPMTNFIQPNVAGVFGELKRQTNLILARMIDLLPYNGRYESVWERQSRAYISLLLTLSSSSLYHSLLQIFDRLLQELARVGHLYPSHVELKTPI